MKQKWLVTCEHGGNEIPLWLAKEVSIPKAILASHRGWDIGALSVAQSLAQRADKHFFMTVSRLCIEANRSLGHREIFSEFTQSLSEDLKNQLKKDIYLPYREAVISTIEDWIRQGNEVVHTSIHSFTPVLNGQVRDADLGFLYDSARLQEKTYAMRWKKIIKAQFPSIRARFNYPYLGKSDGFTTSLRKHFPQHYVGIELELNQGKLEAPWVEFLRQMNFLFGACPHF